MSRSAAGVAMKRWTRSIPAQPRLFTLCVVDLPTYLPISLLSCPANYPRLILSSVLFCIVGYYSGTAADSPLMKGNKQIHSL